MAAGSAAADMAIHEALGRTGEAPPYTRDDAAARSLLPPNFEERPGAFSSAGRVSASIRRQGMHEGLPHGSHSQSGATFALAFCGTALRAWAMLARAAPLRMPTDEEEAAIQRGIAQDPDSPEWTDEMFAQARPAAEVMGPELIAALMKKKRHD
jgi:hypothetical protein